MTTFCLIPAEVRSKVDLAVRSDKATLHELVPSVLDALFGASILEIKDFRGFFLGVRERMRDLLRLLVSGKAGSFGCVHGLVD